MALQAYTNQERSNEPELGNWLRPCCIQVNTATKYRVDIRGNRFLSAHPDNYFLGGDVRMQWILSSNFGLIVSFSLMNYTSWKK
jgi:hypothetical protein